MQIFYSEVEMEQDPEKKSKGSHLGERFFKYKMEVNSMRDIVERHFSKVINEIEAGLPSIRDEE